MFKVTVSYYDLAQCAGIDLYDIPPAKRDKQQLKKGVEAILNKIGLRLTSRPYWLPEWEVVAVDGWVNPARCLFESHWHFYYGQEEKRDYEHMPVHVFVEKYIGYLKYTQPGQARRLGLSWSGVKEKRKRDIA